MTNKHSTSDTTMAWLRLLGVSSIIIVIATTVGLILEWLLRCLKASIR